MKNVFDFGFDFPGMNSEPDVFCSTFSSSGDFGFGSPFQGSSAFAESRTSSSDTGNLVGACAAAGLAAAFGAAAVHHMIGKTIPFSKTVWFLIVTVYRYR